MFCGQGEHSQRQTPTYTIQPISIATPRGERAGEYKNRRATLFCTKCDHKDMSYASPSDPIADEAHLLWKIVTSLFEADGVRSNAACHSL